MLLSLAALLFALSSRPSKVEVVSPMPPRPVVADGKRVLSYELHITNFDTVPLVLQRIEVNGTEFSGDMLKKMLALAGDASGADATRIDPGRRAIAFMWLTMPLDAPVPVSLRHRLTFDTSAIGEIDIPVLPGNLPLLSPPFAGGEWLAGNGPSNDSPHRRSVIALGGRACIAQRFAIDWVKIGKNGDTIHESRERNENFWAFGEPVQAVADGEVTEAVDIFPDNKPGTTLQPVTIENILGNHVILRIGRDVYVVFAHLREHSVRVRARERVKRGAVIANVGNSGNSTGPHLHLEVVNGNSAIAAEGIPFLFDQFTFLGYGKDFEEDRHPVIPRRVEMPVDDEVVRFH